MGQLAVVVVDVLNPYEHDDADALAAQVSDTVEPLAGLVEDASGAGAELVYVNDNHGDFAAGRRELVERALAGRHPELVAPLAPGDDVDFLPKVRHSAFYSTTLEYLLRRREVDTVVLAGQVTEQCVLYTALDAYVRHLRIRVPPDAVAAIHPDLGDAALRMMERNMGAELIDAERCLA